MCSLGLLVALGLNQCIMFSRLVVAFAAIAAAHAQITVEVAPFENENEDTERGYTQELLFEFNSAREDALLLFTEFTAISGADLRLFIQNIAALTNETINGMNHSNLDDAPQDCRSEFQKKLKKIEYDAHRFASFSAENHHKFFLGHMIVFKIHLNKTEDYLKKCEKAIEVCGSACQTTSRVVRWRRLAKQEIARVRDDLHHSKRSYQDLLVHYRRRLNHLRKQATARAQETVDDLQICMQGR